MEENHNSRSSSSKTKRSQLAKYCKARREELGYSQGKLSELAGIKNLDTIGRIERGKTTRLSSKTRSGLAKVFGVSEDYLNALIAGRSPVELKTLQICPRCWQPGNNPEEAWLDPRAKYCFICGGNLLDRCGNCGEPFSDIKHRFCPFCGTSYKTVVTIEQN